MICSCYFSLVSVYLLTISSFLGPKQSFASSQDQNGALFQSYDLQIQNCPFAQCIDSYRISTLQFSLLNLPLEWPRFQLIAPLGPQLLQLYVRPPFSVAALLPRFSSTHEHESEHLSLLIARFIQSIPLEPIIQPSKQLLLHQVMLPRHHLQPLQLIHPRDQPFELNTQMHLKETQLLVGSSQGSYDQIFACFITKMHTDIDSDSRSLVLNVDD